MKSPEHILLLADIHANQAALFAVISDAQKRYEEQLPLTRWFLGDIFGRGPEPLRAWRELLDLRAEHVVVGNHDLGLVGKYEDVKTDHSWTGWFNDEDWQVILKHREKLEHVGLLQSADGNVSGGESYEELLRWPLLAIPRGGIVLVHGGVEPSLENLQEQSQGNNRPLGVDLRDRLVWDYGSKNKDFAANTLAVMQWLFERPSETAGLNVYGEIKPPLQLVIVGHWHRRTLFYGGDEPEWIEPIRLDHAYPLDLGSKLPTLICPGGIGFPREDFDRAAGYAVLCVEQGRARSITFHIAPFDRLRVQEQMRDLGYPPCVIDYLNLPG